MHAQIGVFFCFLMWLMWKNFDGGGVNGNKFLFLFVQKSVGKATVKRINN
jgi:hypothetical protein